MGTIQLKDEDEPKIICENIKQICESVNYESSMRLYLKFTEESINMIDEITRMLSFYNGNTPVYIYNEDNKKTQLANKKLWVILNDNLLNGLYEILGHENVRIVKIK